MDQAAGLYEDNSLTWVAFARKYSVARKYRALFRECRALLGSIELF